MGVSYQAGSAWRHSVFLIQGEKGLIFIIGYEEQVERPSCKVFEQAQPSLLIKHALVFLRGEKFLLGFDGELTEQLWFALSPQDVPILIKNKTKQNKKTPYPHHGIWSGLSRWWRSASIHQCCPWLGKRLLEDPSSGKRFRCHATQAGKHSLCRKKTHHPEHLVAKHLRLQSLWLSCVGERKNKQTKKLHAISKSNWRQE